LFNRVAYQSGPRRYQYNLTAKGQDYLPVAMALHKWSERWLTQGERGNVILSHHCEDAPVHFVFCCSACEGVLHPHDVTTGPPGWAVMSTTPGWLTALKFQNASF